MTDTESYPHRARRNAILESGDLDALHEFLNEATGQPPSTPNYKVLLMTLHKARYHCTDLPEETRRKSQRFLSENGMLDMMGREVRKDDPLPDGLW